MVLLASRILRETSKGNLSAALFYYIALAASERHASNRSGGVKLLGCTFE